VEIADRSLYSVLVPGDVFRELHHEGPSFHELAYQVLSGRAFELTSNSSSRRNGRNSGVLRDSVPGLRSIRTAVTVRAANYPRNRACPGTALSPGQSR
jgi:hypothetical protein